MLILLKGISALDIQSLKLIVVPHLVAGRDLKCSDGNNLAVNFNGANREHKSVDLHEILWGRLDDLLALRDQLILDFLAVFASFWFSFLINDLLYKTQTRYRCGRCCCCAYIQRL